MRVFPTLALFSLLIGLKSADLRAQQPPPASVAPIVFPTPSSLPTAHKQVLPLAPADLLTLLPKTPDKWQTKVSQANNAVVIWASSQAFREFTYTPPTSAPANPGDQPPRPLVLRVAIIDTGYYLGTIADFEKAPSTKPGAVQSLTLSGYPARQGPFGTNGERLRVLINGRYVVQIDVQNQPANSSQQWLRTIDLAKIAALPTEGEETLPRPYTIIRLDEINPQNNSVSQVTYATKEELDRARRRH